MNELSIVQVNPEKLKQLIELAVKKGLETHLEGFKPKRDDELLTPKQVAALLKVDPSTVHRRTKKGILLKYVNGGSAYYKKSEVLGSLIKLNS